MLENPALLLRPWMTSGDDPAERRRNVLDPATGDALGFVRGRGGLWSWLTRQALEIHETQDASLVATVRPPWFLIRSWEVFDAENRRVGVIYRRSILDGTGQRLARLEPPSTQHPARFLAAEGRELATLELRGDHSAVLRFSGADDPFTRMVLLGATLATA